MNPENTTPEISAPPVGPAKSELAPPLPEQITIPEGLLSPEATEKTEEAAIDNAARRVVGETVIAAPQPGREHINVPMPADPRHALGWEQGRDGYAKR